MSFDDADVVVVEPAGLEQLVALFDATSRRPVIVWDRRGAFSVGDSRLASGGHIGVAGRALDDLLACLDAALRPLASGPDPAA